MKQRPDNLQVAWISGMPRSGTTWLSQIFSSSPDVRLKFCPLFSYEFKNALDEESSADDWRKLFQDVYATNSEFLDQDYLRNKGLIPAFTDKNENPQHLVIKSTRFHNLIPHILRLHDQIRFVHVVRHPCATIHSWLTNPNEFPREADPMKEWRTGSCRKTDAGEYWGFDDWKFVTSQALRLRELYPHRFRILRYEDLVQDTKKCVKELFEYCAIPYEKQTNEFIEHSHSKHDENNRSVFKNPRLSKPWLQKLDQSIISACLSELQSTELEEFLKTPES
jgi:hypothetical protein